MLFLASDHAGFELKQHLLAQVAGFFKGTYKDLGAFNAERSDYPFYGALVAQSMRGRAKSWGILVCGSGQGMAICANRFSHMRAALCLSEEQAELARAHNDANALCLGSRFLQKPQAIKICQVFFSTPFAHGRHQKRVRALAL